MYEIVNKETIITTKCEKNTQTVLKCHLEARTCEHLNMFYGRPEVRFH